eukprot:TRINITY_DN3850_c0_g1_i1.p1 TRINITY_DN3850_c0_g1~~TRINITY_DN3850_c0_g1_i1.p1  ORF type:complete len:219 (-),score=57.30 TRINITY_DN3850_c0_g1_i1:37-693(-)
MWKAPAVAALVSASTAAVLLRINSKLYDAPALPASQCITPGSGPQIGKDGLITVIIPAYNEGAGIADTLAALSAATEATGLVEVVIVDGGCSDDTMAPPRGLRLLEWAVDRRTRAKSFPYGDQALCTSRVNYFRLGGFPCVPMMEDFEFVRRAKGVAQGGGWGIRQLPLTALCSPRRWEQKGVLTVSLLNFSFVFRYVVLGWSPQQIYDRYYGTKRQR